MATHVPIPAVPSVTICSQLQSMQLDCRGSGSGSGSYMENDLSLRGLQAFLRCRGLALDGCNVVRQAQVTHISDTNGTPLSSVDTPVIVAFCDLDTESICLPHFALAREKWHASGEVPVMCRL